jgi:DNA-binding response OmpR family regulator
MLVSRSSESIQKTCDISTLGYILMRVLVVEDEVKMSALLRDGLEREGHFVTLAGNGAEGLSLASQFDFEAIILDRMLPNLDGAEVVRRLRKADCATPVLMLTARDSVDDVVSGLDAGVDDYLCKPFALAELYARLRALRRRPPAVPLNVLRFAGLELDMDAHVLRHEGRSIDLTRTELRILEHMMRHPGRVHRRDSLIAAVWGYDCEVESNTLDVFIKQLRDKMSGDRKTKYIRAVRGVGYKLTSETP